MYYKYLLILLLCISQSAFAQNSGKSIFDTSIVYEIRITFSDTSFWQIMTDNYNNNQVNGVPTNVPYLEGVVSIDGHLMDSVGVRQKDFSMTSLGFSTFCRCAMYLSKTPISS